MTSKTKRVFTEEHRKNLSLSKKGKHCSPSTEFKKGQFSLNKHHRWRGGINIDSNGYILITAPTHPHPVRNNYVFLHRLITEYCIGRYLTKNEHIHHINNNNQDNSIKNLYIFSSNYEHLQYHKLKNPPQLISNLKTTH